MFSQFWIKLRSFLIMIKGCRKYRGSSLLGSELRDLNRNWNRGAFIGKTSYQDRFMVHSSENNVFPQSILLIFYCFVANKQNLVSVDYHNSGPRFLLPSDGSWTLMIFADIRNWKFHTGLKSFSIDIGLKRLLPSYRLFGLRTSLWRLPTHQLRVKLLHLINGSSGSKCHSDYGTFVIFTWGCLMETEGVSSFRIGCWNLPLFWISGFSLWFQVDSTVMLGALFLPHWNFWATEPSFQAPLTTWHLLSEHGRGIHCLVSHPWVTVQTIALVAFGEANPSCFETQSIRTSGSLSFFCKLRTLGSNFCAGSHHDWDFCVHLETWCLQEPKVSSHLCNSCWECSGEPQHGFTNRKLNFFCITEG